MVDNKDGDELLSRIGRNVEANLDSLQQRSAWETANSYASSPPNPLHPSSLDPKSSTKLAFAGFDDMSDDDGDTSTLRGSFSTRSHASKLGLSHPTTSGSLDINNWPSPVTGTANLKPNIYHSLTADQSAQKNSETVHISEPSCSNRHPNRSTNINININNKKYTEESTFTRSNTLESSSVLRLADILSQNILLHPFVALRRICQVNRKCSPYICVQPFSLMPFIFHQQRKQGISALYKGLSSELLVKGFTLGTETALSNYLEWPTEINSKRFIEDSLKVVTLRGLSVAICTPFLCSSVIETVQSVIVVKDRPSFIDCLKEGFFRLLHLRSSPTTRIMPIWLLVLPTVVYHMSHLIISYLAKGGIELFRHNLSARSREHTRASQMKQYPTVNDSTWQPQDLTLNYDSTETSFEADNIEKDSKQISSSMIASLIADVALLPIETVLHSMFIQGTRTIIDNCDETTVVLPVLTNYDGFSDCYQSILRFEGNLGLYKGLGAIILQYSLHFLMFRSLYYVLKEFQPSSRSSPRRKNRGKSIFDNSAQQQPIQNSAKRQALNSEDQFLNRIENNRHSTPSNLIQHNAPDARGYNMKHANLRYDKD